MTKEMSESNAIVNDSDQCFSQNPQAREFKRGGNDNIINVLKKLELSLINSK